MQNREKKIRQGRENEKRKFCCPFMDSFLFFCPERETKASLGNGLGVSNTFFFFYFFLKR